MTDLADSSGGLAQLMWKMMAQASSDTSGSDIQKEQTGYALLQIINMIMQQLTHYGDQISDVGQQLDALNGLRTDLSHVITDLQDIQNWQATHTDPQDKAHPDFNPDLLKLVNTLVNDLTTLQTDVANVQKNFPKDKYPDVYNAADEINQAVNNMFATNSTQNIDNHYNHGNENPDNYAQLIQDWQNGDGKDGGWGRFLAYDLYQDSAAGTSTSGVFNTFMNGGAGGSGLGFQSANTDLTTVDQSFNTTLTADGTYMNQIVQSSQNFVSTSTGEASYMVQKQIAS